MKVNAIRVAAAVIVALTFSVTTACSPGDAPESTVTVATPGPCAKTDLPLLDVPDDLDGDYAPKIRIKIPQADGWIVDPVVNPDREYLWLEAPKWDTGNGPAPSLSVWDRVEHKPLVAVLEQQKSDYAEADTGDICGLPSVAGRDKGREKGHAMLSRFVDLENGDTTRIVYITVTSDPALLDSTEYRAEVAAMLDGVQITLDGDSR